ncbi:MAG: alanine racemase [Elusimicrobiaceae bacterium]|nr:alanine racemase [Elusimicrobiaceae bacterium]
MLKQDTLPLLRPTYAKINLTALKENLLKARTICERKTIVPKIMLLVKANAYGHGADLVSLYAQKNNLCDAFAVASIEEGVSLRNIGITKPILVLGSIYPFECFEYALKYNLSVAVASVRAAKFIVKLATELKITAKCHIKQETGMGRIGSRRPAALEILRILNKGGKYICVEGCFSHFSSADGKTTEDKKYTNQQLEYFKEFLSQAKAEGLKTGLAHISASSGFINYPKCSFDMVRLGHLAYGLEKGYKPVLSLHSRIVFIKDVRKGAAISYGRKHICKKPSKIATIPIGYGDGFLRTLGAKASVLIEGKKCPILGNITMDMLMADITKLGDIKVGSPVVLIGKQKGQKIAAGDLAKLAGTIDYEILTLLNKRIARIANV